MPFSSSFLSCLAHFTPSFLSYLVFSFPFKALDFMVYSQHTGDTLARNGTPWCSTASSRMLSFVGRSWMTGWRRRGCSVLLLAMGMWGCCRLGELEDCRFYCWGAIKCVRLSLGLCVRLLRPHLLSFVSRPVAGALVSVSSSAGFLSFLKTIILPLFPSGLFTFVSQFISLPLCLACAVDFYHCVWRIGAR